MDLTSFLGPSLSDVWLWFPCLPVDSLCLLGTTDYIMATSCKYTSNYIYIPRDFSYWVLSDLCQWKRIVSIKIKQVQLAMSTILLTESSRLLENPEKSILGPVFGQDRLQQNSAGCLARSGEIPSPRQTSIDKTNDCVMNSERSALVGGSDSP